MDMVCSDRIVERGREVVSVRGGGNGSYVRVYVCMCVLRDMSRWLTEDANANASDGF